MNTNTAAILLGAACAMIGPAIVHAFTDDPFDQAVLSALIAGAFVIAVLVGVRRQ